MLEPWGAFGLLGGGGGKLTTDATVTFLLGSSGKIPPVVVSPAKSVRGQCACVYSF